MAVFIFWIPQDWKLNVVLLITIVILSWFAVKVPGALEVIWSPYQKLVVSKPDSSSPEFGDFIVSVNNTGYQMITDLSDETTISNPNKFPPVMRGLSQYDLPLLFHPNPKKFLVVGAGAGNDAAGGIRHNMDEIVAVEIDPAIITIGRQYHPEKPYSSPDVKIINDDARSFFASTSEKFDVISFGLLDSHTTTAMTNARLDHYVYTMENIRRAKSLLAEGGVMVLTFEPQKNFVADRMARVLQEVFNEKPLYFQIPYSPYGWGGVMFIAGDLENVYSQIAKNQELDRYIKVLQSTLPVTLPGTTKIVTDDWPYIYLEKPRIPVLYYLLFGVFILIFIRSIRKWELTDIFSRWKITHWHFFFLGNAFLLLEVQNISKASVILGNTWNVNAIIVSGVLVMALIANWIAYKFPKIKVSYVYVALIVTCIILYFVDLAQFAFLPYFMKALVVGGSTTLPMLFSGIIFIRSFAIVEGKDEALGANLVGSLFGALLQSVTFVIGIKALLLIVALFYILSMVTLPSELRRDNTVPKLPPKPTP